MKSWVDRAKPQDVGARDNNISNFLNKVQTESGVAPILEAAVAQFEEGAWTLRWGSTEASGAPRIFDLASITKPYFATLVASLVHSGTLSWTTHLQEVLPEVAGTWAGAQTVEALLSHRSGLAPHVELFRPSWKGAPIVFDELLRRAARARHHQRTQEPRYSDLGYILLGFALERRCGGSLDEFLEREVSGPWSLQAGSARWYSSHDASFASRVVSTEVQPGRGGQLTGIVHDDNAWALRGTGLCGHAGLFSTAPEVARFVAALRDSQAGRLGGTWKSRVEPLTRRRPGGTLRMGLDGISSGRSMAGAEAGAETFGHLGFTGTSAWCDPQRERVTVLLTNRVSPTRDNPTIRDVRPKIHDFLWLC